MRDTDQQMFKFSHEKNFKDDDYFISSSNKHIIDLFDNWPKNMLTKKNFNQKFLLSKIFCLQNFFTDLKFCLTKIFADNFFFY